MTPCEHEARVVSAARRRGAAQTLTVDLPHDLPLVRADATLAERAISNVVANAVAHTPSDARVTITAAISASDICFGR